MPLELSLATEADIPAIVRSQMSAFRTYKIYPQPIISIPISQEFPTLKTHHILKPPKTTPLDAWILVGKKQVLNRP